MKNVSQSFILKPLLKINTAIIAENCGNNFDKDMVELLVGLLVEKIDGILRNVEQSDVCINLNLLGKIYKNNN